MIDWLKCCINGDIESCCKNVRGKQECKDACNIYKILFKNELDRKDFNKHLAFGNTLLSFNYNEEAFSYAEEIQSMIEDDPDKTIAVGVNQIQIRAALKLKDVSRLDKALAKDTLQSELMKSKIKETQNSWKYIGTIGSTIPTSESYIREMIRDELIKILKEKN